MLRWIKLLLQLFIKTLHVNVNIDLRLQTIKGYIDGIKILDVKNVGSDFTYDFWKFKFVCDKGIFTVYLNDKQVWQTNKYETISIVYRNKELSINGFIIPIPFKLL